MSYPRLIQPLIIEDESTELYDAIFERLAKDGEPLAAPIHAYGHDAGLRELRSDRIFHLVLLDLRLPDVTGHPAQEGIDHGLDLLRECAKRDSDPIPALLVISGHLDQADQLDLQRKVAENFHYGSVFVKSPQIGSPLGVAVNEVKRYLDLGIHIRDTDAETYPTIAPRDEDLLRRCLLRITNCIGVDLKWWSAEVNLTTGQYAGYRGWAKTLTGRLLFVSDVRSRLCFFKFAPAAGADTVFGNAEMMHHKLAHIKVLGSLLSGNRSLLITQKVGDSDNDPISLASYLSRSADETLQSLSAVVADVAAQVHALGDWTEERRPLREVIWASHERSILVKQWEQNGGSDIVERFGADADPISLYDKVSSDNSEITFDRQSFRHGDLNITNVAIDLSDDDVAAYIFDASGCAPGPSVRDLATLEVSSLLHHLGTRSESLVTSCEQLYLQAAVPASDVDQRSDLARNTFRLISEIRSKAVNQSDAYLYKLMVFDNALIQLGGLSFGPSCNKIGNPKDAVLLAALASLWLRAH